MNPKPDCGGSAADENSPAAVVEGLRHLQQLRVAAGEALEGIDKDVRPIGKAATGQLLGTLCKTVFGGDQVGAFQQCIVPVNDGDKIG